MAGAKMEETKKDIDDKIDLKDSKIIFWQIK